MRDPIMEGVLLETENMLARGRMDLPLTLCFATLRGDDLLLHHLLKRGLDPNESDNNGRTALILKGVCHCGRPSWENMNQWPGYWQTTAKAAQPHATLPEDRPGVRFLGRFKSEPTILPASHSSPFPTTDGSWGRSSRPRRRTNNFHNSLFGIMSAAQNGDQPLLYSVKEDTPAATEQTYAARVIVSCPERGDVAGKVVSLPKTFHELLQIGVMKYGFLPAKVVSKEGAEIEDIELIRDDDHIVFVSENRTTEDSHQTGEL
nr:potassium channel AKT1-like [Ipomoea batatas]